MFRELPAVGSQIKDRGLAGSPARTDRSWLRAPVPVPLLTPIPSGLGHWGHDCAPSSAKATENPWKSHGEYL